MKIKLYPIVVLCLLFLFMPVPIFSEDLPESNLRINEIMYAPVSGATDEWLEIVNTGYDPIEIIVGNSDQSLKIVDNGIYRTLSELISGDGVLNPGEFAIFAKNPEIFEDIPNFNTDIFKTSSTLSLNDSGDNIGLAVGSAGEVWDTVSYLSAWGGKKTSKKSLERQDYLLANDENNWHSSLEDGGTPGRINNRVPQIPENLNFENSILSWSIPTDPDGHPIAKYFLELYKANIPVSPALELTANNYQLFNLEPGNYSFRVSASDGILVSEFSDFFTFQIEEPKYLKTIKITEIFPDPASPLSDSNDEAIELYNFGGEAINLSGWIIRDTKGSPKEYTIDNVAISPGQYKVFKSRDSKISLNNDGDSIELLNPKKELVSSTPNYGKAKKGKSYALMDNNQWLWSEPTLGAKNLYPAEIVSQDTDASTQNTGNTTTNKTAVNTNAKTVFSQISLGDDLRGSTLVEKAQASADQNNQLDKSPKSLLWLILATSSLALLGIILWKPQKKLL